MAGGETPRRGGGRNASGGFVLATLLFAPGAVFCSVPPAAIADSATACCAGEHPGFGAFPGRGRHRFGAWDNNQHGTHYLFGPSGVRMEQGEGYYQTAYMLMHQAWYAPVEGFAFGGGFQATSLIRAIGGYTDPIVFLGLRGSGQVGNGLFIGGFAMGAHLAEVAPFDEIDPAYENIGLGAAQVSFGRPDLQLTASFGWGMYGDGLTEHPLFGIGGLARVSGRAAIVAENWSLPFGEDEPIRLYGLAGRFMYKAFAADVGFVYNEDFADFFFLGVPYVGLALRF